MAACVIGAVAYCVGIHQAWFAILLSGLVLFFIRLNGRMKNDDFTQRRVISILMFSAICICICAYLMMNDKTYWPIPLLITACLELYSSFRLKS